MIKPLTLGNTTFPINLIQGPLAGISSAPFRWLAWHYGQLAFSCTEMISCKTIIHQPAKAKHRYLAKHANEGPVCYQLSGTNPDELAEAVKRVTDYGANLIDLNCGCPVKKIRQRGAGSKLLTNPVLLFQLITAMKKNTHLPVSIKIRVESVNEKFNQDIAKVVSEAGADFLIVHGRHWSEHYETLCRHEDIAYFVNALKIPVIGNGDVSCDNSLQCMLATGCAGVMIGRAGVGQPWLTKKLIANAQGEAFEMPSVSKIGEILLAHVGELIELLGSEKFAILQARKFAKYYARDLPFRAPLHEEISQCIDMDSFSRVCSRYFS